jgi:negative regulator of sigma-B (phosphoserine phosphatase)
MGAMTDGPGHEPSLIEWASAGMALGGAENESGDLHLIARFPDGALAAVMDGLGHGPEAAVAARQAARILEAGPGKPVIALVQQCHDALRRTRGVVMSLASFNAVNSEMTWIGIGNVETVLLRADPSATRRREAINGRGGVVGYQLPPLRAAALPVSRGDTLIMATDGIRSAFTSAVSTASTPQELADSIMTRHGKGSDDALVLVVRYVGGTS